jgi:hypothetical protein
MKFLFLRMQEKIRKAACRPCHPIPEYEGPFHGSKNTPSSPLACSHLSLVTTTAVKVQSNHHLLNPMSILPSQTFSNMESGDWVLLSKSFCGLVVELSLVSFCLTSCSPFLRRLLSLCLLSPAVVWILDASQRLTCYRLGTQDGGIGRWYLVGHP